MAFLFHLLLAFLAAVGHVAAWTWLYNRLHASGIPSRTVHKMEKFVVLAMLTTLAAPLAYLALLAPPETWTGSTLVLPWPLRWWGAGCVVLSLYVTLAWLVRQLQRLDGGRLMTNETEVLDVVQTLGYRPIGDRRTRWQSRIPGNQILEVHLQQKTLVIPRLPAALDGLRMAQITDLHMTGQLQKEFFDLAIERMNRWDAELVMVTGDLVDKAECIEWIPQTLGRLTSHDGVYVLLGNHDQRLADVGHLRRTLAGCGLIDLGGKCLGRSVRGEPVLLAGNECPWFPPAPTLPSFPSGQRPFSILLSHSPDPLPWARRQQFDLMLAGHTHGGQIRFPLVGPVVCPSRFGVRYASGVFDVPPVVMHVSRGLSGVHTLRFNCPPELTLLELRCDLGGKPSST